MTLECCCCGGPAPAKKQWWNRDKGYGLCGKCAVWIKKRPDYDPEEFTQNYGEEGVHWMPFHHNNMTERKGDPNHAWQCADCGYVYGKDN